MLAPSPSIPLTDVLMRQIVCINNPNVAAAKQKILTISASGHGGWKTYVLPRTPDSPCQNITLTWCSHRLHSQRSPDPNVLSRGVSPNVRRTLPSPAPSAASLIRSIASQVDYYSDKGVKDHSLKFM